MKQIFVQEWGTYTNRTLVCIGSSIDEIIAFSKKLKAKQSWIKSLEDNRSMLEEAMKNQAFFFCDEHDCSVLWFKDWKDEWGFYETLVHELNHAIYDILVKAKRMPGETEAQAYQQEFLFREIRRKLNKTPSRKKKSKKK